MSDTAVEKRADVHEPEVVRDEPEVVFSPRIDIIEEGDKIILLVDMPGVDGGSVDVTVEKDTLTIDATPSLDMPEGYEPVSREFSLGRYRRDFTLSSDVDVAGISAKSRHGVLEVTVPKREEQKPRKIKIA